MKSLGEKRVRMDFNPSNSDYVYKLKEAGANFINLINTAEVKKDWEDETYKEFLRLNALALTAVEQAAMWAVKAATI